MLGGNHIYGLVSVKICKSGFGKGVCKAGAYYLSTVKTKNGIYYRVALIVRNKFLCNGSRLGKTGFLGGNINIIIYMTVTCSKMSLSKP